jgi:hypothetical protein
LHQVAAGSERGIRRSRSVCTTRPIASSLWLHHHQYLCLGETAEF